MITESKFLTELDIELCGSNEGIWTLKSPLIYQSKLLNCIVTVPYGSPAVTFYTDLASVPRVPLAYDAWGDRAHMEAVVHDYLYCIDSVPVVSWMTANRVFLEAMEVRGKPFYIRYPMFLGVCAGGYFAYHKRHVADDLTAKDIQTHKEDTVSKQDEKEKI
jgi:Protein of unknown function (DUF1353)